jgi:hypothetical protein
MAVEHTLKLLRKVGSSDSDIACVVVTKILRLMWSKEVGSTPISNQQCVCTSRNKDKYGNNNMKRS